MADGDRSRGVDRRRFVKALGATGLAASGGLAGCLSRGASGPQTIQVAANTDFKSNVGKIESKLHEVGLSEDIEISAIAGVSSSGARKQQYNRWLSGNLEQPSLFMMDSGWTIPFILRKQLVDISEIRPELANKIQNEYFETFVRSIEDRTGGLYGVPLFPTTGTMLYRKDLVKEAGFSPERNNWATEPLTWQKFSRVTKETMDATDTRWGFSFQANAYEGLACCDFKEFTGSWGGSYFGEKDNLFGPVGERPVTVDSDPVVNATRMVRTFIDGDADNALDSVAGDISPRAVLQWQEATSRRPFANGNVVMHRNWPYAIALDGAEDAFGRDLGVMPIPYGVTEQEAKYDGYGGTTSSLGGWHITLNPSTPKREPALEVMAALTEPEMQLFLFELLGWLPPRPALFETERMKDVPVMGRYVDTLKLTAENSTPRPVTVAWPQESTKIAQQVNAALSGDGTPTQQMQTLKGQLQAIEDASERKDAAGGGGGQPASGTATSGGG
ncbi:extracellular solute-binding protein [Haloarcula onubensis]|uniref:Extracellular solute-binding protein n=1 Tax=Haloarcula onubensis TaxID=2950539 RepID=A0ABU2FN50_9EURY|nr:extracellular solute-binding protein [Halomicroarcula sp. S3CR25-11]MDS0282180.1 extracellular solute-binding protein [Halomicroarcula sp. S3CR25-11]